MYSIDTNKPLKVIYIVNHAVPYGANVALLNILDGVRFCGVEPMVVIGENGALCEKLESRGITYTQIKYFSAVYPNLNSLRDVVLFVPRLLRILLVNRTAVRTLENIANNFDANLIHTNIGPSHIGNVAARRLGIPHVWNIREYQDLYFNMHPIPSKAGFIRKLHCSNNYPIAITYSLFNHYKMKDNARVIYDGVMKKTQTQFDINKNKYFLFVGRLEEAKGIRQLINAFIEFAISNKDFELRIAGGGGDSFIAELHQMVDESGLSQRIHFLGFRHDVYDLMAQATALIVSSHHEGFGFITVEAMFNGCLVIGNNSGGTKEILENENLGILYSGHDELVSALKTVVSKGIESYYPMIKKAQEKAVALYSQEQNAASIYEFYTAIFQKRNSAPKCKQ
jgi:glycosyltransferase involved in cell wall biosynthesis